MKYQNSREELKQFYWSGDETRSKEFAQKCFKILDQKVSDNMTVVEQKLLQYDVISQELEPVIFRSLPFYYETGVLTSLSDGARYAKGCAHIQAGGWTFERNSHLFWEQEEQLVRKRHAQGEEQLYLICGAFNDDSQHFNFNNRPILEMGLKGIYEKAEKEVERAENETQKEFLQGICSGMLAVKKIAEKFADKANEMIRTESNEAYKSNLKTIAETAARVPWEKPQTFYEALNTLAFMRKVLGTLEGVGPNTFGRIDVDLYPFYKSDIDKGVLTQDEAYQLICQFLIIWDTHYDHNMKMVAYADHELENTYTLGGCDINGEPVFNELTKMFLNATREEEIIFPKIKCRFSNNSPKEYFDEINLSVIKGTSTVLYQNDDATIPALVRAGRTIEEARDYYVTGCWGCATNQEKYDHGNYVNLLKPFEFALHNLQDKMEKTGLIVKTFDNCNSFDELYNIVLDNTEKLFRERIQITRQGGRILHKVDSFPIFSSTLANCIENKADYTMNGAKYRDEYFLLFGFPNIVDSLLAMKELVFETHKYTLHQMLDAVRNNWQGYETMRAEAIRCSGWGDGSEESCALANRFNNDLYSIVEKLEGGYGGKVHMGHLTYTEIRWWGDNTLATPDGRYHGDYFSQGLTPSRLKKIPSATSVINSLATLDKTTMATGNVVNIILPSNKIDLAACEGFLRATANSAIMSLQLNCVSKAQLLDAQKHPEKYPHLIVRVCGFSARFTSLSPEWQQEVLTRNFFE